MGAAACGCTSYQDSETFLKLFFTSSCFINMTTSAIESILIYRIHGGYDIAFRTNLEITNETFFSIANDLLTKSYHDPKHPVISTKSNENTELIGAFFENLFPFIDVNNNVNCLMFKLIMCPFTLKLTTPAKINYAYFFQAIKCVNLSNKEADMTVAVIPYPHLCESLIYYLSVILSGYTKVLSEILNENNSDEIVRIDLENNLSELFSRDMIGQYYSKKIISKFIKKIENSKNYITIEKYLVSLEDFEFICKENPQLLNYLELRKDFIEYANNTFKPLTPST